MIKQYRMWRPPPAEAEGAEKKRRSVRKPVRQTYRRIVVHRQRLHAYPQVFNRQFSR